MSSTMFRCVLLLVLVGCAWPVVSANAAEGRVLKVLPHYLDSEGRHTISPSLYDRDAYQALLRNNPNRRGGMRFDVHWKTKGAAFSPLKLILEIRGVPKGNRPRTLVLDAPAENGRRWAGRWTGIGLSKSEYRSIGEVTAWRVSLWEGDRMLAEQKSFLW